MTSNKTMAKQCWNIIVCIIAVNIINSQTLDLNDNSGEDFKDLHKLFSTENKNLTFIETSFKNVSNFLEETCSTSRTCKICFILKGDQMDKANTINLSVLQLLPQVEELWFLSKWTFYSHLDFRKIAHPPLELKRFYFEINMMHICRSGWEKNLTAFLSETKLEVLSLNYVQIFNSFESLTDILLQTNTSSLRALSLSRVVNKYFIRLGILNIILLKEINTNKLEYLDLSGNFINLIVGSVTATFPNLRIIDLSHNMLIFLDNIFTGLEVLMFHSKIEVVDFGYQLGNNDMYTDEAHAATINEFQVENIHKRIKRSINKALINFNVALKEHNISVNQVPFINKTVFCKILKSAVIKSVMNNRYKNLRYVLCNVLPSFQDIMSYINVPAGKCMHNLKIPVSPNLRKIDIPALSTFDNFNINTDWYYVNICLQENSLTEVRLDSNSASFKATSIPLFSLFSFSQVDHIRTLDLSFNQLDIYIFCSLFTSFRFITSLYLQHNNLKFHSKDILREHFPQLELLDISNTNLTSSDLPYHLFGNATQLKHLNLAGNNFTTLNLNFEDLSKMSFLNLSQSDIHVLTLDSRMSLKADRTGPLFIDLSNNPFLCGCSDDEISTMELIQNAQTTKLNFIGKDFYICYEKESYRLITQIDISKHKQNCRYPHLVLILSTTLSNILIFLVILVVILGYKYRYRLLTHCLKFKYRIRNKEKSNKTYDAFISYCAEDRFWVHDTLVKELENKYGFRLLIHYRDFIPGRTIQDEIIRGITESNTVIIVLSQNSIKSNWCEIELNMAHEHFIRNKSRLLVIKLGSININDNSVSNLVKELLQARVYTQWPDNSNSGTDKNIKKINETKQKLFWMQTANILYDNDLRGCCICIRRIGTKSLQSISHMEEESDRNDFDEVLNVAERNRDNIVNMQQCSMPVSEDDNVTFVHYNTNDSTPYNCDNMEDNLLLPYYT